MKKTINMFHCHSTLSATKMHLGYNQLSKCQKSRLSFWGTSPSPRISAATFLSTSDTESICFRPCLFICLLVKYWSDPHENFTREVSWTVKSSLIFGSHPNMNPDLGIFWTNFYHVVNRESQRNLCWLLDKLLTNSYELFSEVGHVSQQQTIRFWCLYPDHDSKFGEF